MQLNFIFHIKKIISFSWQHLLLIVSLSIMTCGVALCIRPNFGSSVIATIPFIIALAEEASIVSLFTIVEYTHIMNFLFIGLQILILHQRFPRIQLFQFIIGFVFGFLLDVNMWLTSIIVCNTILWKVAVQLMGCVLLAVGISLEIRCGSVTMPGEGIVVAVGKATDIPFAKAKIMVDISLVVIAVAWGYFYFGTWQWQVVGAGTLISMIIVGIMVKLFDKHLEWFSRLLYYRPGFRRYIYGLARCICDKIR